MKKFIIAVTLIAIIAVGTPTARAGDREWAAVGKVLTGVAAVAVLANAVDHGHTSCSVSYSTCAPEPCVTAAPVRVVYPQSPVICVPSPVVYVPSPAPAIVCRAPVFYAPRPLVSLNFGYNGGSRQRHWINPHCR